LQKDGFKIAIDDLYVSDDIDWMSLEILDKLLEAWIYPDYLKLDGRHCMAIQNNSISTIELTKIRTLIWQFAKRKPITLVAEWIQDREHAKKIKDLFGQIDGITIIYQGREIKESNFKEKIIK
jgi:EAL domain-containing protein (putative c-di-GMP-specific phosphodiesterase class I)